MPGIGQRIAQIRREARLNREAFAKRVGVSQSAVSDVENEKNKPSYDMIVGIAAAFPDVSLSWLITGAAAGVT
jgi:transcriptional regulator with XRE-family HTH domain